MRIVVNDHLGHAPQVQLSRTLAARGHQVLHLYSSDVQSPKADLRSGPGDSNLQIVGLSLGRRLGSSFIAQRFDERRFGRMVAKAASAFRPDVVVACNNPLDVQAEVQSACRRSRMPFVYWMQDFQAVRIDQQIADRGIAFNATVGAYYHSLERKLLQRSDAIIAIADDHLAILAESWDVFDRQCMVMRNWSPLDLVSPGPKDNPWAREQGLTDKKVALYAGSLGPMENPSMLTGLARELGTRSDAAVVVVSEGPATAILKQEAASLPAGRLVVLPFQLYEVYGQVLASADVLLGFVAADTGVLFVPSKVNSYLCAGRPIAIAAPWQNLAAQTVRESRGGQVTAPDDAEALARAVSAYFDDTALRDRTGHNARAYAEGAFDIGPITDRFERLCQRMHAGPVRGRQRTSSLPAGTAAPRL